MGSSGGGNYKAPKMAPPPAGKVAGQGETAPFNPSFVSVLGGNPMQPYRELTPEMLAASQAGAAQPQQTGADRGTLAEIIARLDAMDAAAREAQIPAAFRYVRDLKNGKLGSTGNFSQSGNRGSGGYTTSGRAGAGGFGSRSSSASRAGGGLY